MGNRNVNRRNFLRTTSAALALSALKINGVSASYMPPTRRVALIGTGWYGKSDLFRLMQVAPVDLVALCDVDRHQLQHAGELVAGKQNAKQPKLYAVYRKLLEEQKP